MRAAILIALLVGLSGCTTPDAKIVTQKVEVAVPVPCKPDLGKRPVLLTKDQVKVALAGAANLDDKLKIISEQLLLYIGWVPVIEAGLAGCAGGTNSGAR